MKYLVMETHPAYAVVLDEEGRFLKAANLHYQVGDTVQTIVELRQAKPRSPALWKPLSGLAAAAACRRVLDYARANPALLEKVAETGQLPMNELALGSGTERKTLERHRKYLVAILLAFTNGYEIIRGHLCQIGPVRGGTRV